MVARVNRLQLQIIRRRHLSEVRVIQRMTRLGESRLNRLLESAQCRFEPRQYDAWCRGCRRGLEDLRRLAGPGKPSGLERRIHERATHDGPEKERQAATRRAAFRERDSILVRDREVLGDLPWRPFARFTRRNPL